MSNTASMIQNHHIPALMRLPDVLVYAPVSKATLYRWIAKGIFPRQRRLTQTGSTVAWMAAEIHAWVAAKETENDGTYDGTLVKDTSEAA